MPQRFITLHILLLTLAGILAASSPAGATGRTEKLTFAIMLPPSLLGKGSATVWDNLVKLKAVVREKEHLDVNFARYGKWPQVISALESGKAGAAWLPPYYYVSARRTNPKSKIRPIAIYESSGRTESRTCVYMIPPEEGFPEYDQRLDLLFGTRISFHDESNWMLLNKIFLDTEYRFEPYYFFKSFRMLTRESAALALLFRELDAVVMDELSMQYIQAMDGRLKKTTIIECSSPLPNTLIVKGASMSESMEKKVRDLLFSLHKNPDYSGFRHFFRTTDGRWVSADKVDFSSWGAVYDTARRLGWDRAFDTLPKDQP